MNTQLKQATYQDLAKLDKDNYDIIDIRDEYSFGYGHIAGAINIPADKILQSTQSLSKTKQLFICCSTGKNSEQIADSLCQLGYNAFNLKGGYFAWLKAAAADPSGSERAKQVEDSIRSKKFKKLLFTPFCRAINEYQLIEPGDKIAVCISGGKDSMLMAKLFAELKRHNKLPFELVYLVMDPGYNKQNREIIESNAKMLNVPITIFETDIFDNVFNIEKSPCYICARMRRGHLYNKAKQLGCNKIALGHHWDDVIETILMGMLYGGQVQTMMPKVRSSNFEGMELIRPLYLIREADIKSWRDSNDLHFIQCACKFTDTCTTCGDNNTGSKRKKVKELIASIAKDDPQIEANIFKSVENVNLSTVIAYKDKHGTKHHFLDEY